jgi:hypothetical protein
METGWRVVGEYFHTGRENRRIAGGALERLEAKQETQHSRLRLPMWLLRRSNHPRALRQTRYAPNAATANRICSTVQSGMLTSTQLL